VINTNVASLMAQKNLAGAQSKLAASVEKLSSGVRINRARDDAAGLGVSESLTRQINGTNQGIKNLNDGISMVQTAEAAIAAASEMGQRMLTLATQGANAALASDDRKAIQAEMKQLLLAIESISGRTKFSGNALLAYDPRAAAASGGLYSIQVSNEATDTVKLSSNAFLRIGGVVSRAATVATTNDDSFDVEIAPPDSVVGSTAYKVDAGVYIELGTVASVSGVTVTLTEDSLDDIADGDMVVFSGQLTKKLSVTADDLSLAEAVEATGVTDTDTNTAAAAFQMIQRASTAFITAMANQRSLLGAFQNQMDYTVSNTSELSTNLQSARSRVTDTDYAGETANLTKGQILQQAATAMLAQANQMPNVVLTLLK